jgi:hypothetical protein
MDLPRTACLLYQASHMDCSTSTVVYTASILKIWCQQLPLLMLEVYNWIAPQEYHQENIFGQLDTA